MDNKIATINDLSDDILSKILSYIDFVKRQRLEIVCKRWKSIIRRIWGTKQKITFAVIPEDGVYFDHEISDSPGRLGGDLQSFSAARAILKLCAGNITDLKIVIDDPDAERPTDTFESLICNKDLKNFMILDAVNGIMTECLEHLPTKCLQEFSATYSVFGDKFDEKSFHLIEDILTKAPGLTSLHIGEVSSLMLRKIELMTELKKLRLGYLNSTVAVEDLFLNTTLLVNLEELDVYDDELVDDRFLFELVKNCKQLRDLNFSSKCATNIGLKAISELPNLRRVVLSGVEGFEVLNYFSNLEEFQCMLKSECRVTEDVLLNFFKRSPNLKICRLHNHSIQTLFHKVATEAGATVNFSNPF